MAPFAHLLLCRQGLTSTLPGTMAGQPHTGRTANCSLFRWEAMLTRLLQWVMTFRSQENLTTAVSGQCIGRMEPPFFLQMDLTRQLPTQFMLLATTYTLLVMKLSTTIHTCRSRNTGKTGWLLTSPMARMQTTDFFIQSR